MTPAEMAEIARLFADSVYHPDMFDWANWSEQQKRDVLALAHYMLRQRNEDGPRLRARALFRSWLTKEERIELRRRRCVTVVGTAGGRYRIYPETARTERLELHGTRWFGRSSYCLHPDLWVPPADVALAHYLALRTDEPGFLAAANEHKSMSDLWNGAYLRRMNAARRARAEAA